MPLLAAALERGGRGGLSGRDEHCDDGGPTGCHTDRTRDTFGPPIMPLHTIDPHDGPKSMRASVDELNVKEESKGFSLAEKERPSQALSQPIDVSPQLLYKPWKH